LKLGKKKQKEKKNKMTSSSESVSFESLGESTSLSDNEKPRSSSKTWRTPPPSLKPVVTAGFYYDDDIVRGKSTVRHHQPESEKKKEKANSTCNKPYPIISVFERLGINRNKKNNQNEQRPRIGCATMQLAELRRQGKI
jgi:hypothetical protein